MKYNKPFHCGKLLVAFEHAGGLGALTSARGADKDHPCGFAKVHVGRLFRGLAGLLRCGRVDLSGKDGVVGRAKAVGRSNMERCED